MNDLEQPEQKDRTNVVFIFYHVKSSDVVDIFDSENSYTCEHYFAICDIFIYFFPDICQMGPLFYIIF